MAWFPFAISGPWDYKHSRTPRGTYDDFGNFNYGAAGAAAGFSEFTLDLAAIEVKSWSPVYAGHLGAVESKEKLQMINKGVQYYRCKCYLHH
jgi:Bacterial toxin 44